MITIATPSILNQANGSFAENKNELDKHKIAASYYETVYSEKAYAYCSEDNSNKSDIKNHHLLCTE